MPRRERPLKLRQALRLSHGLGGPGARADAPRTARRYLVEPVFRRIGSAFVPIEHYDYRPPDIRLDNLESGFADLLNLPFSDRSIASLSCMHVVEHVGLGRYGEPTGS